MTLIPKDNPVRDEKYRRWLADNYCRACGRHGCQAAHLGHGRPKPDDDQCVSLCPDCHREMDTAGEGKEKWWMNNVAIPAERASYRRWKKVTRI